MTEEKRTRFIIIASVLLLIIIGHLLFAQFADYTYLSSRHLQDLFRAKLWSFLLVLIFALLIFLLRHKSYTPLLAVFGVSLYFIVVYAILYRGTQYGLNGHWGDNGYRLAIISKISAYGRLSDAYMKDLPTMYPPLWFAFMAIYAKLIDLEVWQTLKFGYLVLFLIYPWLVYFAWKPLVSRGTAAAIAVATLFFASDLINYTYYEHLACALFIPWWLYFFEDANERTSEKRFNWKFHIFGIVTGTVLFLTYYFWFYLAIAAFPIGLVIRYYENKSWSNLWADTRHKLILAAGITILTAIYWLPLLLSGLEHGFESYQIRWFHQDYMNLAIGWRDNILRAIFILVGIAMAGYSWERWKRARLLVLYGGAVILIIFDRLTNLGNISVQTRKILEYAHVLTMAPLAIGFVMLWTKVQTRRNIQWGMMAGLVALALVMTNDHTEVYTSALYKTGINQRVPVEEIVAFESIDCRNKVFLTSKYIESCYLPYFLFTPVSNAPAHLAGQYKDRKRFLESISRIQRPEVLAYSFANNRYDKIDYFYLPFNKSTGNYELRFNLIGFNKETIFDTVFFAGSVLSDSSVFRKVHRFGIFEIHAPPLNADIEGRLKEEHPEVARHLNKEEPGI